MNSSYSPLLMIKVEKTLDGIAENEQIDRVFKNMFILSNSKK